MAGLTDSYESCRTPHGVRGLKLVVMAPWRARVVAPLTGCVD